jgi:dipeptidyl aminopeptidase/acylaminoacyl peptidase
LQGTFEIEEQVACLEQLMTDRLDLNIDAQRLAIHGWSYGGYMSLMGLAQRPDIFNVGGLVWCAMP